jgi:hypothetical protein
MSETAEEMEARLRAMAGPEEPGGHWDLSWKDVDAIHYALRAIEERRELLAVARGEARNPCLCAASYSDVTEAKDPADNCYSCIARALIAKCEAP